MENLAPITVLLDHPTKQYVDDRAAQLFYAYSGRWAPAWPNPKAALPFVIPAKWIYAYRVRSSISINSIGVEVVSVAAGGTFKVATYSDAPPWPGTLLSSVSLTTDAKGIKTASISNGAGYFWVAIHNTGTVSISMRSVIGINPYSPGSIDASGASAMSSGFGYNVNSATTPPTWPAGTGTDAAAMFFILRAT